MSMDLSVRDLTVAFGGLKALDGVSLTFPAQCITGLIGPNGSGKSTLINSMSGLIPTASGEISIGRQSVRSLRPDQIAARGLARTFQIPLVPPQLTVREVISVPLMYIRRPRMLLSGLGDAESIAEFCGLAPVLRRMCGELSVTSLRRLEIARALACAPAVLLLDEAMAGLSHDDALALIEVVRKVYEAGVTIVVVEHVMSIISSLCEQIIVLNQGKLLVHGSVHDVLSNQQVREAYLGKEFKP